MHHIAADDTAPRRLTPSFRDAAVRRARMMTLAVTTFAAGVTLGLGGALFSSARHSATTATAPSSVASPGTSVSAATSDDGFSTTSLLPTSSPPVVTTHGS